jgi:hypothetical protein
MKGEIIDCNSITGKSNLLRALNYEMDEYKKLENVAFALWINGIEGSLVFRNLKSRLCVEPMDRRRIRVSNLKKSSLHDGLMNVVYKEKQEGSGRWLFCISQCRDLSRQFFSFGSRRLARPRPTSAALSDAWPPRETSTPGRRNKKDESIQRRDEKDKSVQKREDESPVRRTPAKKKRTHKISSIRDSGSGSRSSSDSNSSSDRSSSEDEAMAEDKVIDKSEEEQLRVLEEKRAAHKELKSRMREKATKRLIRRAKEYVAARRKSREAKKEAEKTEAEQQGEEAGKAESSEEGEVHQEDCERAAH